MNHSPVPSSGDLDPLRAALLAHRADGEQEAADLARVQLLVANGRPWDRSTPLHATASAVIVHPPTRRVLLRWHDRQQSGLQVGGHADPGERDAFDIALREAREETALPDLVAWPDPQARRFLHLVIVPVPAVRAEAAHEHADIRYLFATEHPDQAEPERPSAAVHWYSLEDAARVTSEANLRETLARVARICDSRSV